MRLRANRLERCGVDDAVGAVTVHGTLGLFGVIMLGVFVSGYPALDAFIGDGVRLTVSLLGQIVDTVVFGLLGSVLGYVVSFILNQMGMLHTPEAAELAGLDVAKVPAQGYPEGIPTACVASR